MYALLTRKAGRIRAILGTLVLMTLLVGADCQDDVRDEFRTASAQSLQAGVNAILDGLVDGLFAVFDPEMDGADTGTGDGGTGG